MIILQIFCANGFGSIETHCEMWKTVLTLFSFFGVWKSFLIFFSHFFVVVARFTFSKFFHVCVYGKGIATTATHRHCIAVNTRQLFMMIAFFSFKKNDFMTCAIGNIRQFRTECKKKNPTNIRRHSYLDTYIAHNDSSNLWAEIDWAG